MIPRGEVGLVFAGVGSASGVLTESLDAAIIVMVILTTFLAPPLLRIVFKESDETPITVDGALESPALESAAEVNPAQSAERAES